MDQKALDVLIVLLVLLAKMERSVESAMLERLLHPEDRQVVNFVLQVVMKEIELCAKYAQQDIIQMKEQLPA